MAVQKNRENTGTIPNLQISSLPSKVMVVQKNRENAGSIPDLQIPIRTNLAGNSTNKEIESDLGKISSKKRRRDRNLYETPFQRMAGNSKDVEIESDSSKISRKKKRKDKESDIKDIEIEKHVKKKRKKEKRLQNEVITIL